LSRRLISGLTLATLLLVWEALYRGDFLNPLIFASPSLIFEAAVKQPMEFLQAGRTTATEILIAVALSWIGGVAVGALIGALPLVSRIFVPLISAVIAVPFVIVYPVLMAWFGIGPQSKIVFGVLLGVFPIALNTAIGVQAIDEGYRRMASAMGASRLQIIARVMVPMAMPAVIAGLRLGTSLIVVGVILTEMLASTDGIGYVIATSQSMFQAGDVMFGVVLGVALAGIANLALSLMEHQFCNWRLAQQASVE
jgi:NitT/TauT family transport system permease protein/taurine transport system permease protein